MSDTFSTSALQAELPRNSAQRGVVSGELVHLFIQVSGTAVFADNAAVNDAGTPGENFSGLRVHNHHLPYTENSDNINVSAASTQDQWKTFFYYYSLSKSDKAPKRWAVSTPAASRLEKLAQGVP